MTSSLVDQILKMQHDIQLLVEYGEAIAKATCPLGAQLALLATENKSLQTGFFLKEEQKKAPGHPISRWEGAGPPPLLRDVVLGEKPSESAVPSSSAEITQNQQKGKGRWPCISIDSLLGEAIDYNDTESGEESGFWSVHDESDE